MKAWDEWDFDGERLPSGAACSTLRRLQAFACVRRGRVVSGGPAKAGTGSRRRRRLPPGLTWRENSLRFCLRAACAPSGESPRHVEERAVGALEKIICDSPDKKVVLVVGGCANPEAASAPSATGKLERPRAPPSCAASWDHLPRLDVDPAPLWFSHPLNLSPAPVPVPNYTHRNTCVNVVDVFEADRCPPDALPSASDLKRARDHAPEPQSSVRLRSRLMKYRFVPVALDSVVHLEEGGEIVVDNPT
ncbi:MAG: hypothetical protein BJ554DRAFT_1182 [Olpidium bornovanus]|uniref:Uncharacterized protein n=1 Tax=Olpidium bornovanus TaxID=278681 RepID=A0A8H8DHF8_9FUNG|nr:MAG: hypothetical protein BJ554DRAFT_1182 [Olpidium bornovanus]